jgi:hypothetical protein
MIEEISVENILLLLKVRSEMIKKIPFEFRVRLSDLWIAKDLNNTNEVHEIIFRKQVLLKFIEEEYGICIPSQNYQLKKHYLKTSKDNILNYAKYIQQTLEVLDSLSRDYGINPYEYIEGLIKERFIFINKIYYEKEKENKKEDEKEDKKEDRKVEFLKTSEFRRRLQFENRILFKDGYTTNIYKKNQEYYSFDFIKMCFEKVQNNRRFQKKYTQLGQLRMKLKTYLVDNTCVVVGDGTEIKEHRGNKRGQK